MGEQMNEEIEREARLEETAKLYLQDLDLTWDSLRGKRILDEGAGLADFAVVAKRHGVDVISIEKLPEEWVQQGQPPTEVAYDVGDVGHLPYETASFDFLLSHAGPVTSVDSLTDFQAILQEADRVLAPGGEFRFGPVWVNPAVFGWEKVLSSEEEVHLSEEDRNYLINDRVFALLKEFDLRIELATSQSSGRQPPFNQYYLFKKPKASSKD